MRSGPGCHTALSGPSGTSGGLLGADEEGKPENGNKTNHTLLTPTEPPDSPLRSLILAWVSPILRTLRCQKQLTGVFLLEKKKDHSSTHEKDTLAAP